MTDIGWFWWARKAMEVCCTQAWGGTKRHQVSIVVVQMQCRQVTRLVLKDTGCNTDWWYPQVRTSELVLWWSNQDDQFVHSDLCEQKETKRQPRDQSTIRQAYLSFTQMPCEMRRDLKARPSATAYIVKVTEKSPKVASEKQLAFPLYPMLTWNSCYLKLAGEVRALLKTFGLTV